MDEKFNLKMNVDPNLTGDTLLEMGDYKYSYDQISNMFKIRNHEPIKLLVYWDDICQLTSIGLIEVINCLTESNAKIDFEHFFTRPNDYCYGIQYVYKLFEKVLDKDTINKIKFQYYWPIMKLSLKTLTFSSITKISSFIDRIGFFFPYRFGMQDNLRIGFHNTHFPKKPLENVQFYYGEDGVSFNDILKNRYYNCVITPNIAKTYEYILNNDLTRISIVGPEDHNGLTEDMFKIFAKYDKLPLPHYCSIDLYKEQIYWDKGE